MMNCALVELRNFFCYFVKCAIFHHVASRSEFVEFLRINQNKQKRNNNKKIQKILEIISFTEIENLIVNTFL